MNKDILIKYQDPLYILTFCSIMNVAESVLKIYVTVPYKNDNVMFKLVKDVELYNDSACLRGLRSHVLFLFFT